jgi:hypothetical protein
MAEPFGRLVEHLDELSVEGWEPFHIHEAVMSGEAAFLVFSRKALADD